MFRTQSDLAVSNPGLKSINVTTSSRKIIRNTSPAAPPLDRTAVTKEAVSSTILTPKWYHR